MPKTKISEYSATANSNTDVASINIDEGCAPSGINNAIRAVMGHLKDFQQGTNGDPFNGPHNGTVGATTPSTGAFTTLSATGAITSTIGDSVATLSDTSGTTGFKYIRIRNTTGGLDLGVQNNAGTWVLGATANDAIVVGRTGISFSANDGSATQMRISSTGLAVTGSVTSTSSANSTVQTGVFENTSTGTSAINRFRLNGGTSSAFFEVQGSGFSGTNITNGPTTSALAIWTGSNIPVSIGVNASEIGRFSSTGLAVTGLTDISAATSGQIKFPATQNASSNANTLDDYEEGTWTPTNISGMTGFSAIDGTYTKIGRAVQVRGSFSITSVTSNMFVGGLPFPSMAQTFYSIIDQNVPVAIAFKRVEASSSSIQWNVNATGSFSVTISFTAWYFSD